MSRFLNLLGNFMPHFESRRSVGTLSANGAEVVHDLDGDGAATIFLSGTGTFNATYAVDLSPDGVNYYPAQAFPVPPMCFGGNILSAGQPLLTEAVNAAAIQRTLCVAVGQMRKLRIRLTAYTGGAGAVTITSDDQPSINPYVRDQKASTLIVTATGLVGATLTATLPLVAGLRHYIDRISVVRSATAALTPSATPVLVTTTNLPGNPILTFGSDAGGVGIDREQLIDAGGAGLAATAIGTNTTMVCPAYTGVIWRINAIYRLGQ